MVQLSWLTHPLVLGFSVFMAFFWNLWGVPLFDLDEGAFAEATREMLASGNFAATYLDGEPRYDKPIFSYWMQALSTSLFGFNEFALRLPSALAASLWILVSYRFAREQFSEQSARYLVLIMAGTLWVGLIGRAAIADAWLNLFISLAMFDIWRYWQHKQRLIASRVFIWLALGLLTKGPVAIAIPFITSGLFFVMHRQWQLWLGAIFNPIGWGVLLLLVAPWLYLVYQDQGSGFFSGFLLEHNLKRFNQTREGHGGNLAYYFIALPLILLPFSGPLAMLFGKLKSLLQVPLQQFLLIWFALVFVLVSVSQTQLPHYVLYGVTPLLLLFADKRTQLFKGRWQFALPLGFFVLMLALPLLLPIVAESSKRAYEQALFAQASDLLDWSFVLAALVATLLCIWLMLQARWPQYQRLILVGLLQSVFVFTWLIELAAQLQQQPVKNAALLAKQLAKQPAAQNGERNIVAYRISMPSFSVYRDAITPATPPQIGDIIFTRVDRVPELNQQFTPSHAKVLFQQGGIILLEYRHAE